MLGAVIVVYGSDIRDTYRCRILYPVLYRTAASSSYCTSYVLRSTVNYIYINIKNIYELVHTQTSYGHTHTGTSYFNFIFNICTVLLEYNI
jgi:hypothetical protein